MPTKTDDPINPSYYGLTVAGREIEAIDVIEALELGFALGNALKYAWRLGRKKVEHLTLLGKVREDCGKTSWYLDRWHSYPIETQQRPGLDLYHDHCLLAGLVRQVIDQARTEADQGQVIDTLPFMQEIVRLFDLETKLCARL